MPIAASQMQARCSRLGSLSQPKIHRPRKVDSRKNASSPSMASGAPKMSPTKREYVAPVHAELELLHDAGDHAHGEVDQEQLAPELRQPR